MANFIRINFISREADDDNRMKGILMGHCASEAEHAFDKLTQLIDLWENDEETILTASK